MPTLPQPLDLLDAQRLVPSELRTAEWAMASQWTRERAFYMAGVTRAEILQEMQDMVRLHAGGEAGEYELRKHWESFLDGIGYTPEPGTEDSIKDLRSLRRFNVALRTNLALMHEWASKEAALRPGPLRAQPAWELIRLHQPRVPRDWPERWEQAGGEFWAAPGTSVARMIAPKLSPVWSRLGSRELFGDALGVDYPPFAWGSGMGRVGVGAREIMDLGVMSREDIVAQIEAGGSRPAHSPSESLETRPRVSEPALREQLTDELGGLARWDGPVLVFTDPNGTRPMTQADLLDTWSDPLPEPFRTPKHLEGLMQKDALLSFVEQNNLFRDAGGTDRREDLMRLWRRLRNDRAPAALHRGMRFAAQDVDAFLAKIGSEGYAVRPEFPVESWTDSERAAERFAGAAARRGDQWSVMLETPNPDGSDFKDISALVRALRRELNIETAPPIQTESEWLLGAGIRFAVAKLKRDAHKRTVRITLRPAR